MQSLCTEKIGIITKNCVYVFNISSDAEMHTQITYILAIHVRHRGKTESRNIGIPEYKFECTLFMI